MYYVLVGNFKRIDSLSELQNKPSDLGQCRFSIAQRTVMEWARSELLSQSSCSKIGHWPV